MEKSPPKLTLLFLVFISYLIQYSNQLQSSQAQTLLRIQLLLDSPLILQNWNEKADFCNIEPTPTLTVICYDESITQLHIIGNKPAQKLPTNFSMDSFVTTLVKLPSLKVLTLVSLGLWGPLPGKISRISSLEILNISSNFLDGDIPQEFSSLMNLHTLILDDNLFSGQLPASLGSLAGLTVLSLSNNFLHGSLPVSLQSLEILRVLSLSHNNFSGEVPELGTLTSLQVLDLENNSLGPQFPRIGNKVVTLSLKNNRFSSRIPDEISSRNELQKLDLSENRFVGPFPVKLLALSSVLYLNVSGNRFTGMLFSNLSCGADIKFVDLSSNLLTGKVPSCLLSKTKENVLYNNNCLTTEDGSQHPISFCQNEALAVGILPHHRKQEKCSKTVLALSICGGLIFAFLIISIAFVIAIRIYFKKSRDIKPPRSISDNASMGYSSRLLSDARYVSQAMKLGPLGVPGYRTFSLEEIEAATNNFDTSTFLGDGSQGQMYRGRLRDGSSVAIRCLKMKKSHNTQSFMHYIETISKLRHRHLVSALGHCFECYLDDSSVSRLFFIFEYVPNGTLRSWISERRRRRRLTWMQRITAAIGVAKGIQFLHTGIVPGLFSNNLKMADILLDHNLVAKISSYNLPFLASNTGKDTIKRCSSGGSKELNNGRGIHEEKLDVYDFGVIVLELIVGRAVKTSDEVKALRDYIRTIVTSDDAARRSVVDPLIQNAYHDESMKTIMEICIRCLVKNIEDRPSIEDILWNLQFAAQVQDASHSSDGSPASNFPPV